MRHPGDPIARDRPAAAADAGARAKSAADDGADGRRVRRCRAAARRDHLLGRSSARAPAVAFTQFPDFFTQEIPIVSRAPGPGMGPAILGTLLVTGGATLIAVPLGILGAVYLHEYGVQSKFARARALHGDGDDRRAVDRDGPVRLRRSGRCASATRRSAARSRLACLMLPVVIGSTEQMLRLVPEPAARGRRTRSARRKAARSSPSCCPRPLPGIVSGSLLAVARAAGETAPLLFAIGAATAYNPHLFERGEHRAVGADLRQRDVVVRRRAGPRLGRRAHARAADVPAHAGRAPVHGPRSRGDAMDHDD